MKAPAIFAFGLVAFGFLGMGPVTIAVDSYGPVTDNAQSIYELSLIEQIPNVKQEIKREHGFDLNLADLVYFGDRNEAEAYLATHGWRLTGSTIRELFDAHGIAPLDDEALGGFADVRYVAGTLGADR